MEKPFKIGDRVVHPKHGVGFVAGLEEKQFTPGAACMYYVVSIPDTTIWVPVDHSTSGLRRLGLKSELKECHRVLQAPPASLTTGPELLPSLSGRLKQGSLINHCEVVRDLTALAWKKSLYGALAEFQSTTMNVLCQEWAAVKGITQAEASHQIAGLLKKGRAAKEHGPARIQTKG